jgi:ParB family chromosome partitioning protein
MEREKTRKQEEKQMFRKKRTEKIREIPCSEILPSPALSRRSFDPAPLSRLADSIARFGVLEPILVRRLGEKYELVAGERRLRACRLLERQTVPCRVIEANLRRSAELSLAENRLREGLNLFEEAQALDVLMKNFHFTQSELASLFALSQSAVANKLRLLRLSPEERAIIVECGLSERHARALLKVQDPELRRFALGYVVQKEYNVRRTEAFISSLLDHPDEFVISLHAPKRPPLRKALVRDVRLFINSVDKAIFSIQEAGFRVEAEKEESEDFVQYSIRVPKTADRRG